MSVTYEDVEVAVATLLSANKALTLANLRSALGDRGSMSTLSKYLQQWKEQRYIDSSRPTTQAVSAPPAPDTIFTAVQSVWQQMQGIGQQQIAEKEALLAAQKSHFEEKESILKSIVEKQSQELQDLQTKYLQIQISLQDLEAAKSILTQKHESLMQQYQLLQQESAQYHEAVEKNIATLMQHNLQALHAYQGDLQNHMLTAQAQKSQHEAAVEHIQMHWAKKYEALESLYHQSQTQIALLTDQLRAMPQLTQIFQVVQESATRSNQTYIQSVQDWKEACSALKALRPPHLEVSWSCEPRNHTRALLKK